jgi:protein-tyrosine phosphatase
MPRVSVCFVCLGNICRSPTAEGVMRHLVREAGLDHAVEIDSAGTSAYHVGEAPDRRARAAAQKRGIVVGGSSRQFVAGDFARFDYVIAMDRDNHASLTGLASRASAPDRHKIHMLRAFDAASGRDLDVPDPYYGGDRGFDEVLDICDAGCRGLLAHLRREHGI